MIDRNHLIYALGCLLSILFLVSSASSNPTCAHNSNNSFSREWIRYKQQYNKSYHPREDYRRCKLLLRELNRITTHNSKPNITYKIDLDFMSDWYNYEFEMTTGPHRAKKLVKREAADDFGELDPFIQEILNRSDKIPSSVDWTKESNRVGRVKFQLGCGACWAFATTGLLEGQQVARNFTKRLVELSEQQLIDCLGNRRVCSQGGRAFRGLEIVAEQGGIVGERDYPYDGYSEGFCQSEGKDVVMKVKNFARVPADEAKIATLVARYGPLATSMSLKFLRGYQSGIITGDECGNANHEVLIVGYGSESGLDYWLVKNSWSADWGDAGYFKIKRGENVCGIAGDVLVATF